MRDRLFRYTMYLSVLFFLLSMLLSLISWLITAIDTESQIKSLLSSEGLRWMCGNFVGNVLTPFLAWLLLIGATFGVMKRSTLHKAFVSYKKMGNSQYSKTGLRVVVLLTVISIAVIGYLAFAPHAILLSVSGSLLNSSFSAFIVPFVCTVVCIDSISYGSICGTINRFSDVFEALCDGVKSIVPLLVLYMFVAQFVNMLLWITSKSLQ